MIGNPSLSIKDKWKYDHSCFGAQIKEFRSCLAQDLFLQRLTYFHSTYAIVRVSYLYKSLEVDGQR